MNYDDHPLHPDYCKKRVPNGLGAGRHQCTRKPVVDGLCQQHYDQANPQPFEPKDQAELPVPRVSATVTVRLRWEDGKGPLIKGRWVKTPFFAREVEVHVYTGSTYVTMRADGYIAKRNGQPGNKGLTNVGVELENFVGRSQAEVQRAIEIARERIGQVER